MVCVTALKQCTEQMRTVGQKKRITPFYFNTNYRTEMKLVSNTMVYCLLHFAALKFCLGVLLHGEGSLPKFNLF